MDRSERFKKRPMNAVESPTHKKESAFYGSEIISSQPRKKTLTPSTPRLDQVEGDVIQNEKENRKN